ncbi:MAG TPA: hypothetical protein VM580_33880, partial [Labilithrix sp.]|nr:hypothetical protein [Labilithrix sp.]
RIPLEERSTDPGEVIEVAIGLGLPCNADELVRQLPLFDQEKARARVTALREVAGPRGPRSILPGGSFGNCSGST